MLALLGTASAAVVLFAVVHLLVGRRAATLAVVVLATLPWLPPRITGHAPVHGPFTGALPPLARALAPWTGLVPFALVRGRSRGRIALAVVAVCLLAAESVLPVTTPILVVLAGVVGAELAALDASAPDALLALGVVVVDVLVLRDAPALGWTVVATTATTAIALLAEASWLPVRRSVPIALVGGVAGLVLRAKA